MATRVLVVECPGWPENDARGFEPVVAAVESFTPRVEVLRPGTCTFATRGPSRYFGGEEALADKVAQKVDGVLVSADGSGGTCQVGIADGRFAAEMAARTGTRVPAGGSTAFLAPLPVAVLPDADLADVLRRLGVLTLGQLATLPAAAVLARFGPTGRQAQRLARGHDDVPLAARVPPVDLTVASELEPPVVAVERAAFAGKSLADQLGDELARRGLTATCVRVEAETEHGEHLARLWRHDRGFTAAALAQRVRWQLEGWDGVTGGITMLRLVPEEVGPDRGRQLGFWGARHASDERIARALARVQGKLGHETVVTGVVEGAREVGEQIRLVPWGEPLPSVNSQQKTRRDPPWPGVIPPPGPATIHPQPVAAEVVDASGIPVTVTGRGQASAEPDRLAMAGGPWVGIEAWAGPWLLDERWWDTAACRRRARWQLVTADGSAHLVRLERGRWWVEASY